MNDNETSNFNETVGDVSFDSDKQLGFERDGEVVVIGSNPSRFVADAAAVIDHGALSREEEPQCAMPVLPTWGIQCIYNVFMYIHYVFSRVPST